MGLKFYQHFLSFVADGNYTLVASGDFNTDSSSNNYSAREFNNVLPSNGFINVIQIPTRITTESQSTLDLIITNFSHPRIAAGVLSCPISDHLPVFLCMDTLAHPLKHQVGVRYQSVNDATLKAFRNALTQVDWTPIINLNDANEAYNNFLHTFKELYNFYFPLVTRKPPRKTRKPWITPELRHEIKIKDKLYRTFLTTDDLKFFKQFRNKLTKKLRAARTEYYSAFLDVKKGRHDIIWSRLNLLLHRNQSHNQVLNVKINDKELTGTELANAFNNFSTNMKALRDACNCIGVHNKNTIFLEPTTM